eukprot:COSAG05_NODE_4065_length_1689_cov_2.274843_1_plen_157_part_00
MTRCCCSDGSSCYFFSCVCVVVAVAVCFFFCCFFRVCCFPSPSSSSSSSSSSLLLVLVFLFLCFLWFFVFLLPIPLIAMLLHPKIWRRVDANGDGSVSCEELCQELCNDEQLCVALGVKKTIAATAAHGTPATRDLEQVLPDVRARLKIIGNMRHA